MDPRTEATTAGLENPSTSVWAGADGVGPGTSRECPGSPSAAAGSAPGVHARSRRRRREG